MADTRKRFALVIAMLGVCALASAALWLGPAIVNTRARGDSPFLLQRTFELAQALRDGAFPVRWMPDAAYGLGYPFFNFYATLPYYIAAGLNLGGLDVLTAIKLAQTLGMFAAAGSMWLFARQHLNRVGAFIASSAYVLAPFHLVNVYVRGDSLSEFFAFVWFPLILWAIDELADGDARRARGWAVLALATAALVLTHNVSALIFAPFAGAYALLRIARAQRGQRLRRAALIVAAVGVGLLVSAWFWAPALVEARDAQLDQQTTGYFNYAIHYLGANLVQADVVFDYTTHAAAPGAGDRPMQMGLLQTLLAVLGFGAWAWSSRKSNLREPLLFGGLFVAATFMLLPLSDFVWANAPLLPLAQFPWRFLSVQAMFAALLAGGLGMIFCGRNASGGLKAIFALALAAVMLVSALARLPNERLNIRADDVNRANLLAYEWFSGNIGTTIRAEYLPRTTQPRPMTGFELLGDSPAPRSSDGAMVSAALEARTATSQRWRVTLNDAKESDLVAFPLLFWPAWRATLDGRIDVPLAPHPGTGWAALSVPSGEHVVELWLDRTPIQRVAEIASLIGVVMLVAIALVWLRRAPAEYRRALLPSRFAAVVLGATLGALLVFGAAASLAQRDGRADEAPNALRAIDFATRPFPHRDPIRFTADDGKEYTLLHAAAAPTALRAGDAFNLSLDWLDGRAPPNVGVVQVAPSSAEGPLAGRVFRYARAESRANAPTTAHVTLPDATRGPLLLQLVASDANGKAMRASAGGQPLERATLFGLVVNDTRRDADRAALREFPNGIRLHDFDWFPQDRGELCFRATWSSPKVMADALQVSLRLRGEDGREIARADGQPHVGFTPTWAWQPNQIIADSYCGTPSQSALTQDEPYTLDVIWYRVSDGKELDRQTLSGVTDLRPFTLNQPK